MKYVFNAKSNNKEEKRHTYQLLLLSLINIRYPPNTAAIIWSIISQMKVCQTAYGCQ